MKQQAFRITALLLCLVMIFALGACSGNGETESDSSNPDAADTAAGLADTLPSGESTPPATEIGAQGEETVAVGQTGPEGEKGTTAKQESGKTTAPATKAQQDSQPKTTAEIVTYYNAAANKIKTDKPGYTKKYAMQQFPGSQATLGKTNVPSWLVKLISKNETTTVKKGSSSRDTYPAAGFDWASKLTAQYVQNATCTKSGSSYKIKITLKDETNPPVGKGGYGTCMSVIDKAGAEKMVPLTIKSITMKYHSGYISATVDINTGRMTAAELSASCKMENMETSIGTINADIQSTETFTSFQW